MTTQVTFPCRWSTRDALEVQHFSTDTHFYATVDGEVQYPRVAVYQDDCMALALELIHKYQHTVSPEVMISYAEALREDAEARLPADVQADEEQPEPPREPKYLNLAPQSRLVYQHMKRAGSISPRDAMADHGMAAGTLARRICDIEVEGFTINRERKTHPITGNRYTRYTLAEAQE